MRLLVVASLISVFGVLPVYAYSTMVQPQLDSLEQMYSSMDQTAQDIANSKDFKQTDTYQSAVELSSSRRSD